jgi:hypothetical protein
VVRACRGFGGAPGIRQARGSAGRTITTKKALRRSAGLSCLVVLCATGPSHFPCTKRPILAQVRATGERCPARRIAANIAKLPGSWLACLLMKALLMSDPPPGPSTVLRSRIDGPLIHATVV